MRYNPDFCVSRAVCLIKPIKLFAFSISYICVARLKFETMNENANWFYWFIHSLCAGRCALISGQLSASNRTHVRICVREYDVVNGILAAVKETSTHRVHSPIEWYMTWPDVYGMTISRFLLPSKTFPETTCFYCIFISVIDRSLSHSIVEQSGNNQKLAMVSRDRIRAALAEFRSMFNIVRYALTNEYRTAVLCYSRSSNTRYTSLLIACFACVDNIAPDQTR